MQPQARYANDVRVLFGATLARHWPLWEISGTTAFGENGDGVYAGVVLNDAQSPLGNPAPLFPLLGGGGTVAINADGSLGDVFDPDEGALAGFSKAAGGVWIDGEIRVLAQLAADANNLISVLKEIDNALTFRYVIDGIIREYTVTETHPGWFHWMLSWSKSNNRITAWINGVKCDDVLLDTPHEWVGALSTTETLIGGSASSTNNFVGWMADVVLLSREPSETEAMRLATATVRPKRITILGDSISANYATIRVNWDYELIGSYNGGWAGLRNHAHGSRTILSHLADQATASINDDADVIVIEMGVNDDNAGDMAVLRAIVEAAIDTLRASNPRATIYYMNLLPIWTDTTGTTIIDKSNIRAMITTACAAKDVVCWDTFTNPWIDASDTEDGVHPTLSGADKIVSRVLIRGFSRQALTQGEGLTEVRDFWVDIEDNSGQKLGRGPLRALNFNCTSLLSACGEFSFEVSDADPNRENLVEKRVAICRYIDQTGSVKEFGSGVIDKIVTSLAEDGSLVWKVSGNDLGRELTYRSVGALDLSGVAGAGVLNAPEQIMALAPTGWTITDGMTLTSIYAGFDGESILNALIRSGEKIGEHWRLDPGRMLQWLGEASYFIPSGVRAVQHVNDPVSAETVGSLAIITSLEEESDAAEVLTRVIPRGAGNGGAVLTLWPSTGAVPDGYTLDPAQNYVKRDDAELAYGRIERVLDFKDIGPLSNTSADIQAAANMLLLASVEHLRRYGAPQKFYRLGLICNQLLAPGTTIEVVYRKLQDGAVTYDLAETFNILKVERQITAEGVGTVGIGISAIDRLPQTDSDFLASQAAGARILATHQQLGASVDTISWRDELDDSQSASFSFWLGDEYTSVQRALLRFRIRPLRSTVKSVAGASTTTASGGGSTSGSGGSSTPTSSSGGGQTANGGSHLHNTSVVNHAGNKTVDWYEDGGFISPVVASGGPLTFQVGVNSSHDHTINAHTHDVSIPNHTHTTPDHTHTLTPVITTVYGIFEESAANTLVLANLQIWVNSGSDLRGNVVDIGGGWYELDITDALTDSVFRPVQAANSIEIATHTAKTARIEAQLTIRGVVQAVSYD